MNSLVSVSGKFEKAAVNNLNHFSALKYLLEFINKMVLNKQPNECLKKPRDKQSVNKTYTHEL